MTKQQKVTRIEEIIQKIKTLQGSRVENDSNISDLLRELFCNLLSWDVQSIIIGGELLTNHYHALNVLIAVKEVPEEEIINLVKG